MEVPDVRFVLLDLLFGEHDGMEVLMQLKRDNPNLPVAMLTAHGSVGRAVQAMKLGAADFLTKPPDIRHLELVISSCLELARERPQEARATHDADSREALEMLGQSQAIQQVRELINDVAPTDATVLIVGESGTGKELAARAIHAASHRNNATFLPVNMAALPATLAESVLFGHEKGAFTGADQMQVGWCEMADKGTLFLDEIGEMDVNLQSKLLRFLQENTIQRIGSTQIRRVDVRVVAATNAPPQKLIQDGRLREDLYYRLNVVPLQMPPLRERHGDVKLLANAFLKKAARRYQRQIDGFSPDATKALEAHRWPGNVRELENVVQRLVILRQREQVELEDLPDDIRRTTSTQPSDGGATSGADGLSLMEQFEKQAIVDALEKTNGNATSAAKLLGIGQATVYRKMKRYGISLQRDQRRSPI